MKYKDLTRVTEAPGSGQMLAYTREEVIFQKYVNLEEVEQKLADTEILELHLFDEKKEYRSIVSRSPRSKDGKFETVAEFPADWESVVYKETVMLEKEFGTAITVLNHIHYDENSGMADIDNYRLRMGENNER